MINKKSEKFTKARETLSDDQKPIYDQLVDQYAFHTERLFGKGYVAYGVLAALVQDGWRCISERDNISPMGG